MSNRNNQTALLNQQQVETGTAIHSGRQITALSLDDWRIEVEASCEVALSLAQRAGHTLVHVDFPAGHRGEYHLDVMFPPVDMHRSWIGQMDCWRGREMTSLALNTTWDTAVNRHIPAICNYSREGENRGVISLADHKPMTIVNQRTLIDQPPMQWLRVRFSRDRDAADEGFRETIVINRQSMRFGQAITSTLELCNELAGVRSLPAPAWARQPVWCSWYSHLYVLTQAEVEAQIEACKAAGIGTLLIDASWFKTPEVAYAHVWGDYEVEKSLMPDLPALVKKVHDAGLKIMLWCSPLYVGHNAKARAQMERYCAWDGQTRHHRLCVRCPEARQFAAELVARLMRDYQLDGLKLDFMDRVDDPPCVDSRHPHEEDFGQAMAQFMAQVRDAILLVNPAAAIEYRIAYSTPAALGFANCHRGNDSPYDADYIRRENLYLRMFTRHPSAVWSDYAYWHVNESDENVGLMLGQQILSGGVPTLSIDMNTLSPGHRRQVHSWLAFYREHADSLARAALHLPAADSSLSESILVDAAQGQAYILLAGQHIPAQLEIPEMPALKNVWLLNTSAKPAGNIQLVHQGREQTFHVDGRALHSTIWQKAHS